MIRIQNQLSLFCQLKIILELADSRQVLPDIVYYMGIFRLIRMPTPLVPLLEL
jgi:hypothetical protein